MSKEYIVGQTVVWNGVECTIHHFSQMGMETVAWLEGVPPEKMTVYAGWQFARLSELN